MGSFRHLKSPSKSVPAGTLFSPHTLSNFLSHMGEFLSRWIRAHQLIRSASWLKTKNIQAFAVGIADIRASADGSQNETIVLSVKRSEEFILFLLAKVTHGG